MKQSTRKIPKGRESSLIRDEVMEAVCENLCRGLSPTEIARVLRDNNGIALTRQQVYQYVQSAGRLGLLRYEPRTRNDLSSKILQRFPKLHSVNVVRASSDAVVNQSATRIMEIVRTRARLSQAEVHIGVSGGDTIGRVIKRLADFLADYSLELPESIVFHALVAGLSGTEIHSDPTSFFTYLTDLPTAVHVEFALLHTPALVRPQQINQLLSMPPLRASRESAWGLDLIVTMAEDIDHCHSQLRNLFDRDSPEAFEKLRRDGCVGDLMSLPLNNQGPIDLSDYPARPVTLMDLPDLSESIQRGTSVLLVHSPCMISNCSSRSASVLGAILNMPRPLISDMVLDSTTAQQILRFEIGKRAASTIP